MVRSLGREAVPKRKAFSFTRTRVPSVHGDGWGAAGCPRCALGLWEPGLKDALPQPLGEQQLVGPSVG